MSIYTMGESLRCHGGCLGDRLRTESFERAIAETIRPGDIVLDVGTGTGILAFFACRAGASRVYAIDPNEIIAQAEQISRANGFSDRINFVKATSTNATLPEPGDLFIAGHIHNFALEQGLLSSLLDARKRLLKKSARFIPQSFELSIVPVESPEAYREIAFWQAPLYGLDFSIVGDLAANNCFRANLTPDDFLAEPQTLLQIDSATFSSVFVSGQVSCTADRAGVCNGIGGWFRARLSESVELSNDPRNKTADWAQIFFPLANPIPVAQGDRIEMTVSTNDGELWRWKAQVGAKQSDQCSGFGRPLPDKLPPGQSAQLKPKLSRTGEAALYLLTNFNGESSAAEIQGRFLQRYSGSFKSATAALDFFRATLSLASVSEL